MGRILVGVLILTFACGFAVGQEPTPDCDLNNDGEIDNQDLFLFMREWHRVTAETTFTPTPTQVPTLNPTSTPAPPTMTPEPPTYTISGYVAEFPGCGGRMRGVTITLLPLGATTETSLADGSFSFSGIPDGEYTLTLFGYCNPFGCYPDTPVTVAGEDVFVEICPLSGGTPTPTETHTPAPTQTPGPEEITVNLPGLPADATPLVMVRIPAGTFEMGWPPLNFDELPTHAVQIGYDFFIARYEITQAQWLAIMEGWPGDPPGEAYGLGDNYPAYFISWNDCQDFIAQINTLGQGTFRLPTEAEWEYACRAGTDTAYYFGHHFEGAGECGDPEAGVMPGNYSDYMWFCGNNGLFGSPNYGSKQVGRLLPNPWALYDMSGNILEWCQDWYHMNYEGAPSDGSAWESPEWWTRVLRGGAWLHDYFSCRSADRLTVSPGARHEYIGLRVVRDF